MTTIYLVHVEDAMEGSVAVPTLREAQRLRRVCGAGDGQITKAEIRKTTLRDLFCAIYNREGFTEGNTEIAPDKPEGEDA